MARSILMGKLTLGEKENDSQITAFLKVMVRTATRNDGRIIDFSKYYVILEQVNSFKNSKFSISRMISINKNVVIKLAEEVLKTEAIKDYENKCRYTGVGFYGEELNGSLPEQDVLDMILAKLQEWKIFFTQRKGRDEVKIKASDGILTSKFLPGIRKTVKRIISNSEINKVLEEIEQQTEEIELRKLKVSVKQLKQKNKRSLNK